LAGATQPPAAHRWRAKSGFRKKTAFIVQRTIDVR